jgi:hypothetical protein
MENPNPTPAEASQFSAAENAATAEKQNRKSRRELKRLVKGSDLGELLLDPTVEPKDKLLAWLAVPSEERVPKTQSELAKIIGVSFVTVSRWKNEPGFFDRIPEQSRRKMLEFVPDALAAARDLAVKKDLAAIRFCLELAGMIAGERVPGRGSQIAIFIGGKPAEPLPVGLVRRELPAASVGAD